MVALRYISSPKHHEGPLEGKTNPGIKGSICPASITLADAQAWLTDAVEKKLYLEDRGNPKKVFYYRGGEFFIAQPSADGEYHGFPCDFREVPAHIKKRMKKQGILTSSEYKKFLVTAQVARSPAS
ncbi:MAG: hypothetical protein HYZ75_00005 [Elusimicrobia bacterium]|nr:hypothetical protein [Elusimicrobiota bacterium]